MDSIHLLQRCIRDVGIAMVEEIAASLEMEGLVALNAVTVHEAIHEVKGRSNQDYVVQRALGPARVEDALDIRLFDMLMIQRQLSRIGKQRTQIFSSSLEALIGEECLDLSRRDAEEFRRCLVGAAAEIASIEPGYIGGDQFPVHNLHGRRAPENLLVIFRKQAASFRIEAKRVAHTGIDR